MKIIETHYLVGWDDAIRMSFDIETKEGAFDFNVVDGNPTIINFNRDLCNIHNIPKLIKLVYEAGKRGEELEYIVKQIDQ